MNPRFLLFLLTISLIGCNDSLSIYNQGFLAFKVLESDIVDTTVRNSNTPIRYLADIDFKAWTELGSLEERFQNCNIPDSTAEALTTNALIESVVHYPLNYLIFVYDDPFSAVRLIVENSRLHRELLSRADASEGMIEYFSKVDTHLGASVNTRKDVLFLPYVDELFLEYFLSYWAKTITMNQNDRQRLRVAVETKMYDRSQKTKTYSQHSLTPLIILNEQLGQNDLQCANQRGTTTIYTPMGHTLVGYLYSEFRPDEIEERTNELSAQYPNATVLRPASAVYNCHSYAWHSDSTSNNVWLVSHISANQSQLMRYWTFDWYKEWYESASEKATYMQTSAEYSHSARITSSGTYISKWGPGPLMQHSKTYCPYSTSEMHYYRAKTFPENEITIMGDAAVLPSTTHIYYIDYFDSEADPYDYVLTVTYLPSPGQSNTHTFTTINKTSQIYGLECYEYGAYKIRAEYERIAGCMTYGEKLVACVGARTMQRIQDENVTDLEALLRDNWESISE